MVRRRCITGPSSPPPLTGIVAAEAPAQPAPTAPLAPRPTTPAPPTYSSTWTLPCLSESCFDSPEAAKAAANAVAAHSGYAVVSKATMYDSHKRPRRVVLACDRHGQAAASAVERRRNTTSRKCGCPMQMNVIRMKTAAPGTASRWQVQHRGTATEHNHPPSAGPETHPELRKASWTEQARRIMLADARAGVPVKQTLDRLAREAPDVIVTKADLYNERRRIATRTEENSEAASTQATGGDKASSEGPRLSSEQLTPSSQRRVTATNRQVAASEDVAWNSGVAVVAAGADEPTAAPNYPLQSNSAQVSSYNNELRWSNDVVGPEAGGESAGFDSPRQANTSSDPCRRIWDLPCLSESSFESLETARAAVNAFAGHNGYAVVHRSTRYDKEKQPRRIILACDRHGTKRQRVTRGETHRRSKTSRRCGCPMRVNLVRLQGDGGSVVQWHVQHRGIAREHNHPPSAGPSAHPILRRESRTEAVRDIIAAGAQASIPVSQTLARLAMEAPGVVLTARDVYNQRRIIAASNHAPLTQGASETSEENVEAESYPMLASDARLYSIVSANSPQAVSTLLPPSTESTDIAAVEEDLSDHPDQELAHPMTSSETQSRRTWDLPCLPESSFASPEAARAAVNAIAGRYGYAVVHRSTRYDGNKQPRRIILACDRHGAYRQHATRAPTQLRYRQSRRCGCPMRVNLVRLGIGGAERWQVKHRGIARVHNHAPSSGPSAHPILRRESRTDAIRQIIAADAQAGIPVTQTLARIAVEAPGVILTARDVYNQRHNIAVSATEV